MNLLYCTVEIYFINSFMVYLLSFVKELDMILQFRDLFIYLFIFYEKPDLGASIQTKPRKIN